MSITIEQGITIGPGITLGAGAPTPPAGTLEFNPAYNYFNGGFGGNALAFSNNNTTVLDNYPGEYSTITNYQMSAGSKYMVSYTLDLYTDPISWIGIANTNVDLANGLGYDNNSIGFNNVGDYRFGNTIYGTNYCNFTNNNDVIDLAVDTGVNLMWIRVNGGDWNNNPTADPVTTTNGLAIGGLSTGYPALAVGGQNYYSQFSINQIPQYSVPTGYTFLGAGYSFTLNASDITNGYYGYNNDGTHQWPSAALGTNGNEGFTLTFYPGQPSYADYIGNDPYWCAVNSNDIALFFNTLVGDGVITNPHELVLWDVTWGPGSTHATGVVALSGIASPGNQMYMCPVDTTVTGWDTNPPNSYATKALPGTYTFPATFKLRLPKVDKGGWC